MRIKIFIFFFMTRKNKLDLIVSKNEVICMYICIYIFHKFLIQITYKNEAIYIFIHYIILFLFFYMIHFM